jgi:hypothetical protein
LKLPAAALTARLANHPVNRKKSSLRFLSFLRLIQQRKMVGFG